MIQLASLLRLLIKFSQTFESIQSEQMNQICIVFLTGDLLSLCSTVEVVVVVSKNVDCLSLVYDVDYQFLCKR